MSSGDAIADRRFAYAEDYRAAGDLSAAAELMAQALELQPLWAGGWLALGEVREARGEKDSAIEAYRRSLVLDSKDRAGAAARLARLGVEIDANALTADHVAALFDDYAPRFEDALLHRLDYRAPELLRAAVLATGRRHFGLTLDLGCGTGLAGAAFRDLCDVMEGIDLSAEMLKLARTRSVYHRLLQGEIVATLGTYADGSADLVLAADVVVYLGDLGPLFRQARRVLAMGGVLAFTAQRSDREPFAFGHDLRYAHSEGAIRDWAAAVGLVPRVIEEASTRKDAGAAVPGLVVVLENSAASV